jgi:hypothetical protein
VIFFISIEYDIFFAKIYVLQLITKCRHYNFTGGQYETFFIVVGATFSRLTYLFSADLRRRF